MHKRAEGTFDGCTVVVHDSGDIRTLHDWENGRFGELVDLATAPGSSCRRSRDLRRQPGEVCLSLSLPEAYYLAFSRHMLRILPAQYLRGSQRQGATPASTPMEKDECWRGFVSVSPRFAYEAAAYCVLRDSGWLALGGLAFGADFALYTPSSKAAHAELCAVVHVPQVDAPQSWIWLQRHARLCQQVAKGLMLCEVTVSGEATRGADADSSTPAFLADLAVSIVRVQCWSPCKAGRYRQAGAGSISASMRHD